MNDHITWTASPGGRVTSHSRAGLDVDGYIAPLQGEPPPAQTHGWGDLSWLTAPKRSEL